MVKIWKFDEVRHVVKKFNDDKFGKEKFVLEKNKIKDEYSTKISDLFKELLQREPDEKGKNHYLSLLMKNETTIEGIRNEIINGQEYFDRIITNVESIPKQKIQESEKIISDLFKELLQREPDKVGLKKYSVSLASEKMTEEEIRNEMRGSEEYLCRIKLKSDNVSKSEQKTYKKIINKFYIKYLDRLADNTGLNRYTLFLANGQMTDEEIRNEIKNSSEAIDIAQHRKTVKLDRK